MISQGSQTIWASMFSLMQNTKNYMFLLLTATCVTIVRLQYYSGDTNQQYIRDIDGTNTESSSYSLSMNINHNSVLAVNTSYVTDSKTLRILFWTEWAQQIWWYLPDTSIVQCGDLKCHYTHDKSLYDKSDGVLFFFAMRRLRMDGVSWQSSLPSYRRPEQYWIAHFQGPPSYNNFKNINQMNNIFNLSGSYHHKADVRTPYGYCEQFAGSEKLRANNAKRKKGLVSWFVSHCNTQNGREHFAMELKKYINVRIYGGCKQFGDRNVCSNKMADRNCDDARQVMNSHKFYLAFENTNCVDYVTEKVYKILETGMSTVPIIMSGVSNLKTILPPKSYIDVNSFSSAKELAEYLLKLDKNDRLYNEYFKWRSTHRCILNFLPCSFCRSFHDAYGRHYGENTLMTEADAVFGMDNCENPVKTFKGRRH